MQSMCFWTNGEQINTYVVMFKDKLSSLPKDMLEYSNLTLSELSNMSGVGFDRLQRIVEGNESPKLGDIEAMQEATGLGDEIIAEILSSK